MPEDRRSGIDSLRTVLIACVVLGHYTPFVAFEGPPYRFLWVAIDQSLRFVIPCFFVLSGYYFAASLRRGGDPWVVFRRYARRILAMYGFWNAAYLLIPTEPGLIARHGYAGAITELFVRTVTDPQRLLFEGFREHLWFLVSLLLSLLVVTLAETLRWRKTLLALALGLFLAGLCMDAWVDTPLGIPTGFNARNGPFFGLVFVVLGGILQRRPRPPSLRVAIALSLPGWALYLGESLGLQKVFGTYPRHEYVLSSLLWGPAVAMIALARPDLGRGTWLARLGPLAVGIYLVHLFFVDLAHAAGREIQHWTFELAGPVLAFAASVATVLLMARWKPLGRFVR